MKYGCKEPGCDFRTDNRSSLGGHVGRHIRDRQRRAGMATTPPPKPVAARAEPPRRNVPPPPRGIPKTVEVVAALEWPCPDCGRVYDDGARLDHHRRVIHDEGFVVPRHEVAGGDVWAWAEKVG